MQKMQSCGHKLKRFENKDRETFKKYILNLETLSKSKGGGG